MRTLRCDQCGMEIQKASYRVQISHLPILRCLGGSTGGEVCQRCGETLLSAWNVLAPTAEPPSNESGTEH